MRFTEVSDPLVIYSILELSHIWCFWMISLLVRGLMPGINLPRASGWMVVAGYYYYLCLCDNQ